MRLLLVLLLLALTACGSGPTPEPSPTASVAAVASDDPAVVLVPPPAEHLVLLDVSGSMKKGGYGDKNGFSPELVGRLAKLLAPDGAAFREADPLTLMPFADPTTRVQDPVATTLGQASQALDALEGPGGGATNLKLALETALQRPSTGLRFLWILTDNENNFQGQRSDLPYYELLRDDPRIGRVWFFPLAAPQSASGGPEGAGALVLYLVTSPLDGDTRWVEPFVRTVETRLTDAWGFAMQGVLFRPLYVDEGVPALRVGQSVTVDDARGKAGPAVRSGERIQVPLNARGEGRLHFQFESRLDGWAIEGATLKAPRLTVSGAGKPSARLDRRTLSVRPRKTSKDSYALTFSAPKAPGRIQALVELEAEVRLSPDPSKSQIRPDVDDETRSRMDQVKGLSEILSLMLHQGGPATSDERAFQVRIPVELVPPTAGSGMSAWVALLLALLLAAAGGVWAMGRQYRLETPDGEESLRLGGVFRRHPLLSRKGELLGHLTPGPRVVPEEGVTVDGMDTPVDLGPGANEFVMQSSGEANRFRLEGGAPVRSGSEGEEGPAV